MTPTSGGSLVDGDPTGASSLRIAEALRQAILAGELAPGERIRQEVVAERANASRLPVREALRILEAEGLVEQEPNKGARVARLDRHELDGLYRIRERIEPLALSTSIPYLDDDVADRLDALQDEIEHNGDSARFLALDRQLHLLSYSGCPIEHLRIITTRLRSKPRLPLK